LRQQTRALQSVISLLVLLCLALPSASLSMEGKKKEEKSDESREIMRGVMSSFSLPLRDLLKKKYPSEWRNFLDGFSGSFGFNCPVKEQKLAEAVGQGSQGQVGTNMTLNATLKYNPISYWYIQTVFYEYLRPSRQAPWDPDFTYVFGYDDWHPYTFSLVYSNYNGNHFNPDRKKGEDYTKFEEGTISIGWKYVLPKYLEDLFIVHPTGGVGGGFYYNVTPRYSQASSAERGEWKHSLNASLNYVIYKWFYVNAAFYYYPDNSQQQPWDPDFTYGFGYFDWHPGTISVQYNNYSGNRYPCRKNSPGTGTFENGSFSISWSWGW